LHNYNVCRSPSVKIKRFGEKHRVMKTEKGVIVAAYKHNSDTPRYVVLKRTKNWEGWELPKGHLEESYEDTVLQELQEEAGVSKKGVKAVEDLEHTVEWSFEKDGEKIKREYRAFLVELGEDVFVDVSENPHDEHDTGLLLRYRDVKDMLSFEEHVKVLEKAHQRIRD